MIETVQLFKPWYGEAEYEALRRPLETGWLGYGPLSRKFEDQFADYIGADYAIALNSCTAALHLAFLAAEITSGEVISTPMTFVASNHAILIAGARPVFCDIEADTLNINVEDVASRITSETKAILANSSGLKVLDEPAQHKYPLANELAGQDEVYVGRIRQDKSVKHGLSMWIVADNVRKGAALNAVQIAETLHASDLLAAT